MAYAGRPDGVAPVSDAYVRASPEAGGKNVVNVILVDFRAFDTMGEISVLTVAALGVLGLVRAVRRQRSRDSSPLAPLRRSFVLDAAVRSLFQTLLLVSVLLLLAGHDEPGGGFVAGLVAGSAFLLVYLAGGDRALRLREPLAAEVFLGAGLVTAISAGSLGWLRGGVFLESRTWKAVIPVMGTMKISTALLFEIGVYLVVVGVTMSILRALGREEVYET
ncbi:MAG: hydrogen gas-evolving membrane-bound hydrogenase subunit E [Microthrixaceae bacterium]